MTISKSMIAALTVTASIALAAPVAAELPSVAAAAKTTSNSRTTVALARLDDLQGQLHTRQIGYAARANAPLAHRQAYAAVDRVARLREEGKLRLAAR